MKIVKHLLLVPALLAGDALRAWATEEAKYTVVEKHEAIEIRDYAPHIVAETVVESSLEGAGDKAFKRLFQYISGNNLARRSGPAAALGSKEPRGQKISMTSPVEQRAVDDRWAVSFMMPSSLTRESLPAPKDPQVVLRSVPARRVASIRYSGLWSEERYLSHKSQLESWIARKGLTIVGEPHWARYDPPFTPWFMRRNEVLIPIAKSPATK